MQQHPHAYENTSDFIGRLDDLAGCDPDFDGDREELEREFAELRLSSGRCE